MSDPYSAALLHAGGALRGRLSLHGVSRARPSPSRRPPARGPASTATSSPTAPSAATTTASTAGSWRCATGALHAARAPCEAAPVSPGARLAARAGCCCALVLACAPARACRRRSASAPRRSRCRRAPTVETAVARPLRQASPLRELAARPSPNRRRADAAPLRADPRSRPRRAAGAAEPDPRRAPQHRPADLHLRRGRRRPAGARRTAGGGAPRRARAPADRSAVRAGALDTLAALSGAHANLEVRLYNPVLGRARINYPQYAVAAACCWRKLNQRMHTKLLLVDGAVGITGGRNYQDDYYDWDAEYNFRDRDLLVAGPVAREMAANFEAFWDRRRSVPAEQPERRRPAAAARGRAGAAAAGLRAAAARRGDAARRRRRRAWCARGWPRRRCRWARSGTSPTCREKHRATARNRAARTSARPARG